MAPTVYMFHASPPVRAVLMTAKAIGLHLNEKELDFFNNEHVQPEYLKLNPQHTVPTLVDDDGFVVWESHAIMAYLVTKYARNDALYPKDLKKRAIIDQRLHFESGVLFAQLRRLARPIFFDGQTYIDQKNKDDVLESYGFLEKFLEGKKWIAGDNISIADYSVLSSVSSLAPVIAIDAQTYPKLTAWLKQCEALPEYEVNRRGVKEFSEGINNILLNA